MECEDAARRSAVVAAAGVVLVFAWQAVLVYSIFAGNWSALFCTGSLHPSPPGLEKGTYIFRDTPGYDGQFYRYIAHDPLFRKGHAAFIDDARLRYRRILMPGLAWALAAGRDEWVDPMLRAVVLASLLLGVYWCGRWMALHGRSPAWGLLFLLTPAAITSAERTLTDASLTALFAGFAWYAARGRWPAVYAVAAAAMLARETGALLVAAAGIYFIIRREFRKAALFSTAALPALAWYAFVSLHTSASPGPRPVWPFQAVVARLFTFRPHPDPWAAFVLQGSDLAALAGFLGSILLAVFFLRTGKAGPAAICAALFALLAIMLGGGDWLVEAYSYGRPMSPLLLFVAMEAAARRLWFALAAPLAVTASVVLIPLRVLAGIAWKLAGPG